MHEGAPEAVAKRLGVPVATATARLQRALELAEERLKSTAHGAAQ